MASLPAAATFQLTQLADALQDRLGDSLLGLILHGSAATSGFDPKRSDLDLLGIVAGPLAPSLRDTVGHDLLSISANPFPLEISLVAERDLERWSHPCPYELHFGEDIRARVLREGFAPRQAGDDDLAAHLTVARARGIDLLGRYAIDRLPAVPRTDFLAAVLSDFRWASERQDHADYLLANASRTLAYLRSGLVLSKVEGVDWCRANGVNPSCVVADVIELLRDAMA